MIHKFRPCYTYDIQKEGLQKEGFKMTEQRDKTISVRVSEEEKELIQKSADEKEETLTGYIRGVVFPKEDLEESQVDKEKEEETSKQLKCKDKEIVEKNKEIAGLRKALEEQQKLTLSTNQTNQELQKKVNDQEEKNQALAVKETKNSQQFSALLVLFLLAISVILFGNKE